MSASIGPGDVVECVCNEWPGHHPVRRLIVGGRYVVKAVGLMPPDDEHAFEPWVRVVGVNNTPGKLGFRLTWFRPVYRPRADLIEQLKTPAPEIVRELLDA